MINKDVTNIDFFNLTVRVRYINTSIAASNNYAKKLMVEVRKKTF
jgi:hypothetical protein